MIISLKSTRWHLMMVTRVVSRWATRPKQGNFDGVARSLNAHLARAVREYDHGFAQQNGAVYQLLRRSGVSSQSLPLKKACYVWPAFRFTHVLDLPRFAARFQTIPESRTSKLCRERRKSLS